MMKTKTKTKKLIAVGLVTLSLGALAIGTYYWGQRILVDEYGGLLPPITDGTAVSEYRIRARMTGASSCDSGMVNGNYAQCGLKYVGPVGSQAGTRASIDTTSDTVTVIGYGEFTGQICANTASIASGSGTATCTAGGRTYTAYGEKGSGSIPSPGQASCSFTFNPNPITRGQSVTSTWSSSNDAEGRIQYSCRCADGACEYVNSGYGGVAPDIYERGELGSSGSTTTFSPPETVNCTMTVVDSANVQNTCAGNLTVNSGGTTPPPTDSPYKIRAMMFGSSSCDSGYQTGTAAQCGLKYVGPAGSQAGTRATIDPVAKTFTVTGYGEFTNPSQVCTNTGNLPVSGGISTMCSANGILYQAYVEIGVPPATPPTGYPLTGTVSCTSGSYNFTASGWKNPSGNTDQSKYYTQIRVTGSQSCDGVGFRSANCSTGTGYVGPSMESGALGVSSIDNEGTANDSLTVVGRINGEIVCTETAQLSN